MYLDEHVWAPLIMSVAFIVALLGVTALGAYVVYCDRKNRAGEADLAAGHSAGHGIADPAPGPGHPEAALSRASAGPAGDAIAAPSAGRRSKSGVPPES